MSFLFLLSGTASPSHHYTEKQLDALATRVGKTFWVVPSDGRLPSFLAAPSASALPLQPSANQSFEIIELVGRAAKNPYYRLKFDSGKEGYIHVEAFHEQFNTRILTVDPSADEKKKLADQGEEEKKRVAWIEAQPWSQVVKDAAIKRQVVPGMKSAEVKRVLGNPTRIQKTRTPHKVTEEHWYYADGKILVFQNQLLNRTESQRKSAQ